MGKKIVIFMVNFFLSISLLCLIILAIFSNTVLSKNYILKVFEKSNYYEKMNEQIKSDFENYSMQLGLDKDVFDNIYSIEKLKSDINHMLDVVYEKQELKIDKKELENALEERVNKSIDKENITNQETKTIETFKNNIINVYVNDIIYSQKYIQKVGETFTKIISIVSKAELVFFLVTVFFIMTVVFMSRKELIKIMGVAFLTAGTLEIFFRILIGGRLNHIWILNDAFSGTLNYLINMINSKILIMGIFMLVLGVLGVTIGNMKKEEIQNDKNTCKTD